MKKSILVLIALVLCFQASTSPLALIVLNASGWDNGRLPADWQVKVNHGRPEFSTCRDQDVACVHLRSQRSSFALERAMDVNPAEMPFLTWNWKVTELPRGADFRRASTDDQAAQVLVAFEDRRILSYIWDTSAPQGTMQNASSIPLVHVFAVVCESGGGNANRWIPETRNVVNDYQRAYGKPAPRVKGIRIQINSQHTGTSAESFFGEVAFRSTLP